MQVQKNKPTREERKKMYRRASQIHTQRIKNSRQNPTQHFVFTDGSYHADRQQAGFGIVILKNGQILQQIAGNLPADKHTQSIGEFFAVQRAIEWCEEQNASHIVIHYDCQGIKDLSQRWVKRHDSHLTKPYTDYHMFMKSRELNPNCHIELKKVKAHSADLLNNWADRLAKLGLYKLSPTDLTTNPLPAKQSGKSLLRMLEKFVGHPLELQYA